MTKYLVRSTLALACLALLNSCTTMPNENYDVVIRNGTIYDGSGARPYVGDVAIRGDKIVAVGKVPAGEAEQVIDAKGMAVSPGFINMLSWATVRLIHDGRSQSDIRQGVTLEVVGEGESMGPLSPEMRKRMAEDQGDIKYPVEWNTLGEFLEWIEKRGISCNLASYVGTSTIRQNLIGEVDRPPTAEELEKMKQLVAQAMEEGAIGTSSSLIYAPGVYASTKELTELCKVAAKYDGLYTSHLRSEGNAFLEAVDEFLQICRDSGIRGEIFHLKAAGQPNWHKMDQVIARLEKARAAGMPITADMYVYTAGQTGLDAMFPPWAHDGGYAKWVERMRDPATRARLIQEISTPSNEWENFYLASGTPDKIILIGFRSEKLKPLTGKTLAEISALRKTPPIETAMDLIIEDGSRVEAVYFLMSEENVRKQIKLPWVAFCSDSGSFAPEGIFLKSSTHPRAYGNFARLLGKYVREEKVIPLEAAIHRLTAFPAENLKIKQRGSLKPGYYADVVVFDPATIQDHATFDQPHQYSTGVQQVFVNGIQVLKDGEHTGAKPGRIVRGPGWKGNSK